MTMEQDALDEMDYTQTEGQFGREWDTSIPCQLRFTEEPDQHTEQFHDFLESKGFTPLDSEPDKKAGERPHYAGEICSKEDYKRIKILVMRGNIVRIYPREDQPTIQELYGIIRALEYGFCSPLEHYPIDQGRE